MLTSRLLNQTVRKQQ